MTLNEIQDLEQNQQFDVTALVSELSEARAASTGRVVRDIKIIDQSGIDDKVQEIRVAFYHDSAPDQKTNAMIELVREAAGNSEPLSFFALSGKKVEGQFVVTTTKHTVCMKAQGERASRLETIAETLHSTPSQDRQLLEQSIASGRHYKNEEGVQTFCAILKTMNGTTNVRNIDEGETVWQINWVEVAWPEGSDEEICTTDGTRLWFSTQIRDGTGLGPSIRMTEDSALSLARLSSKDEFLEMHRSGKQSFPPMATIKVLRKVQKRQHPDVQGEDDATSYINFIIVEAGDQPLHEAPTRATLELLPWLPQMQQDSASVSYTHLTLPTKRIV